MSSLCLGPEPPDGKKDCENLHKALHERVTDKLAVIRILAHRRVHHRSALIQRFREIYNEDLRNLLETKLNTRPYGHLKKAMLLWMLLPVERDATILKDAFAQSSRKLNQILVEILWTKTLEEINAIEKAYACLDGRPLQNAIESCVQDQYCKQLFIRRLNYHRNKEGAMNVDANRLNQAAVNSDTETLVQFFASTDCNQLNSILRDYRQTHKHDILLDLNLRDDTTIYRVNILEDWMKGRHFKKTVAMVIKCVLDLTDYLVKVLFYSMKGFGTDDDTLIRVIVTRAEVDMKAIQKAFIDNSWCRILNCVYSVQLLMYILSKVNIFFWYSELYSKT